MLQALKPTLLLGAMLAGAVFCSAQTNGLDAAHVAAIDQAADQFMERLHQTLDFGAQSEMFAANFPALNREYPGEFPPFATPRMSTSLLRVTDDATMRRKLFAEWNLYYWTSLLMKSNPKKKDPAKALPSEFNKAARKSKYLQCFAGGGVMTLINPEELSGFLAEAEQLGAILKKNVRPELLASEPFQNSTAELRKSFGPPRVMPLVMGFEKVYLAARNTFTLVMVEQNNQFKLVTLAPLQD
jgi:hypothetical protein